MKEQTLLVKKNDIAFTVRPERFCAFWHRVANGGWEDMTYQILDRFLRPTQSYIDVGAWIGPTLLYGAHKAKHVFGIEPDPAAYVELVENIELNPLIAPKITLIHAALTDDGKTKRLYVKSEPGDSWSSVVPVLGRQRFYDVHGITMDDLISRYAVGDVNFLKVDIEGGEYALLPSMREYLRDVKPTVHLSLHPFIFYENADPTTENKVNREADCLSTAALADEKTEKLLESIQSYKYIYSISGSNITRVTELSIITNIKNFGELLLTDESW